MTPATRMPARALAALALAFALAWVAAAPAEAARSSTKKGIWGPVRVDGVSQFPVYEQLGAGVYSYHLRWYTTAKTRPAKPRDPADPAYAWPAELDDAIAEASRHGMKVAVEVQGSPTWANGDRARNRIPRDPLDYARFMQAASKRYPAVRYWIVWAEPTRRENFLPLIRQVAPDVKLNAARRQGPRNYAVLLDAAYGALKNVDRRDKVVGGNSFTGGDVGPLNFIRALRLPNGRVPRMDLYGHNPFTARRPNISKDPQVKGLADLSDIDTLGLWVDRYLGRGRDGKRLKLWLGEFTLPTDHENRYFNFYVTQSQQASWLTAAYRLARRAKRVETLSYFQLYDMQQAKDGLQADWGLLDRFGNRKPAFAAFAAG